MDNAVREMTLAEWVERLPTGHSARAEFQRMKVDSDNLRFLHEVVFPEFPRWDPQNTPPLTLLCETLADIKRLEAENIRMEQEGNPQDTRWRRTTTCHVCEGTGYAPNCTEADRNRGDLWACPACNGTAELDSDGQ